MSTKALMTVEQYAQTITEETAENYELVEGELILMPGAPFLHNIIRDHLCHLLWIYFKSRGSGVAVSEAGCRIANETVRIPDLSVFPGADRIDCDAASGFANGYAGHATLEINPQENDQMVPNNVVLEGCARHWD